MTNSRSMGTKTVSFAIRKKRSERNNFEYRRNANTRSDLPRDTNLDVAIIIQTVNSLEDMLLYWLLRF